MSEKKYHLTADNWSLFYGETVTRPDITPLPRTNWLFGPSLQSEADLLAFHAESDRRKSTWNFAGLINLKFNTGLTVGGIADAESTITRGIYFDRILLVEVKKFSSSYGIEMSVPHWVPDISLFIWEYTGDIFRQDITLLETINAKV